MPVSSPSVFPSAYLSPSPPATASSVAGDVSAKQLAWQAPIYFAVILVIVALISAIILIMWDDRWKAVIQGQGGRRRVADLRRLIPGSTFIISPAQTLVNNMLSWFSTTLLPAFRNLRQVTATPEGSATPGA